MIPDIKKVDRYEIVRPIGRGGFAVVYLGRDPYINRSVALKVSETEDASKKTGALSRLFKEAEAAGALIHQNIVTIYDAGMHDELCYIAMEYVEGTTLYRHCLPEELLPLAKAIEIVIKVCHGLDFAHQRGVIHRDIKPSNILLGDHGEIKIADFGLACFAELASQEKRTVGTPSYMPPEQVMGKGSSPQSDLFSLGVILYQLACGQKPFDAQSSLEMRHKIASEPHIPLLQRNPELPPRLAEIIDRALAKKPEDRYRSGFEFARELEAMLLGACPIEGALGEKITQLRTLRFFEDFTDEEIAKLLTIGTWLSHKKDEVIIRENERGSSFFVIASGSANALIETKKVGSMDRGDCFGEMSFLLQRSRSATIVANDECQLLRLSPEKIDILPKETQIKLYRLFARNIAVYLLKAEGKA